MKESRFAWARGKTLRPEDFVAKKRTVLIERFIYGGSITMIYSPPKQGKTWLGYGMARAIARHDAVEEIHYLDMDNSLMTLKERNIHQILLPDEKIYYHTRATIGCAPMEQLEAIAAGAKLGAYEGVCFFLDTTKDFVDTDSKTQAGNLMRLCVRLRDAGATVIVMHHATKDRRGISGHQVFLNTPDNVYSLKQISELDGVINYELKVTHARSLVTDHKWSVDTATLTLMPYDAETSGLSDEEKRLAKNALSALRASPNGMSLSALVLAMGFANRTDRTGKRIVRELEGIWWEKIEQSKNRYIYYAKETS